MIFIIMALFGALIVIWIRGMYLDNLTRLALEYAGADFEGGVVPPPEMMLRGIANRAQRLEHRAGFLSARLKSASGATSLPLDDVHESLISFIKDIRDGKSYGQSALRLATVVAYVNAVADAPLTSPRLRDDLDEWYVDVNRWMRVTHHIYRRLI